MSFQLEPKLHESFFMFVNYCTKEAINLHIIFNILYYNVIKFDVELNIKLDAPHSKNIKTEIVNLKLHQMLQCLERLFHVQLINSFNIFNTAYF